MGIRIGVSPYQRAIEVGRRGAGRPAVAHRYTVDVLAPRPLQLDGATVSLWRLLDI